MYFYFIDIHKYILVLFVSLPFLLDQHQLFRDVSTSRASGDAKVIATLCAAVRASPCGAGRCTFRPIA